MGWPQCNSTLENEKLTEALLWHGWTFHHLGLWISAVTGIFAIASFFALLCHYLAPNLHEQKVYFRAVKPRNWVWPLPYVQKCSGGTTSGFLRIPRSGLTWFNVSSCHAPEILALTSYRSYGLAFSSTASSVSS